MCWKPVPDWLASCRQVEWTSSSTSPVRHSGRLLSLFFSFLFYSHISPVHLGAQQQTSPGQSRRSFELEGKSSSLLCIPSLQNDDLSEPFRRTNRWIQRRHAVVGLSSAYRTGIHQLLADRCGALGETDDSPYFFRLIPANIWKEIGGYMSNEIKTRRKPCDINQNGGLREINK